MYEGNIKHSLSSLLPLFPHLWGTFSVVTTGMWHQLVVGELFACIIQERLQVISEKVLPESQCGSRKGGRGCCDMIFVARQGPTEGLRLCSREAPWQVLEKCGVLSQDVEDYEILSHEGMEAEVRVGATLSE